MVHNCRIYPRILPNGPGIPLCCAFDLLVTEALLGLTTRNISTINVTCPGDLRAESSVFCPGRITAPKYQVTDEDAQSDWSCTVAEYDVEGTCRTQTQIQCNRRVTRGSPVHQRVVPLLGTIQRSSTLPRLPPSPLLPGMRRSLHH
jgi:hypothetical protein